MAGLALVGGFVLVFGFVLWLAFRSARKVGEVEAHEEAARLAAERAREAASIDEAVRGADPDRLRDELRPDDRK